MKKIIWLIPLIILIMVICCVLIFGLSHGKHEVILKPDFVFRTKHHYYREGKKVKIYFNFIATDTDYTFYVDGEEMNVSYSERLGYVIEFIMPNHDVIVTYKSQNSMLYRPKFNVKKNDIKTYGYYEYYQINDRIIYLDNEISEINLDNDVSLKDYLNDSSLEIFLENLVYQSTVKDGGTIVYQDIDNIFNVIICNAINGNKNVYIVLNNKNFDMNYCQL